MSDTKLPEQAIALLDSGVEAGGQLLDGLFEFARASELAGLVGGFIQLTVAGRVTGLAATRGRGHLGFDPQLGLAAAQRAVAAELKFVDAAA